MMKRISKGLDALIFELETKTAIIGPDTIVTQSKTDILKLILTCKPPSSGSRYL